MTGSGNPMHMGQFESLLWEHHPRRLARIRASRRRVQPMSVEDDSSEWNAAPVGRLGRPLLREVALYLEFFALARDVHD